MSPITLNHIRLITSLGFDARELTRNIVTVNCLEGQLRGADGKCGHGVGVGLARTEMPQIRGEIHQFVDWARSQGVRVVEGSCLVDELQPTQADFRQERVDAIPLDKAMREPVIISQDYRILDGTHRWLKLRQLGDNHKINFVRLDLPLEVALSLMRRYPGVGYALNVFCPTGKGGGVDATCSRGESIKSKFTGAVVGKKEIDHSAAVEAKVAKAVGGKILEDNEPLDVRAGSNAIEVKTLLKGKKQAISVHDDALLRKVEHAAKTDEQFHTVVIDERATYDGGQHSDKYSGHRIYYKRGSGRYALSQMHKVESLKELREMIAKDGKELPAAAKGDLPKGKEVTKLRQSAAKAKESRQRKDSARKERLKAAGTSAYERQT